MDMELWEQLYYLHNFFKKVFTLHKMFVLKKYLCP